MTDEKKAEINKRVKVLSDAAKAENGTYIPTVNGSFLWQTYNSDNPIPNPGYCTVIVRPFRIAEPGVSYTYGLTLTFDREPEESVDEILVRFERELGRINSFTPLPPELASQLQKPNLADWNDPARIKNDEIVNTWVKPQYEATEVAA